MKRLRSVLTIPVFLVVCVTIEFPLFTLEMGISALTGKRFFLFTDIIDKYLFDPLARFHDTGRFRRCS